LLDAELRRRIHCAIRDYRAAYGDYPQPRIEWIAEGGLTLKVSFVGLVGPCDYGDQMAEILGEIAQRYGIEWGGDWHRRSPKVARYPDPYLFQAPGLVVKQGVPVHDPWPEMPGEKPAPYDTRPHDVRVDV
jgi:hypothetical protein